MATEVQNNTVQSAKSWCFSVSAMYERKSGRNVLRSSHRCVMCTVRPGAVKRAWGAI